MTSKSLKKLTKRLVKGNFSVADIVKIFCIMRPFKSHIYAPESATDQTWRDQVGYCDTIDRNRVIVPPVKDYIKVGSVMYSVSKNGTMGADRAIREDPAVKEIIPYFVKGQELYMKRMDHIEELEKIQYIIASGEVKRRKELDDAGIKQ
jgi:hypothetical protein